MELTTFFENFESLISTPKGVQKLRQLILQLAVMGKLVPQDSSDEPASILLEKIRQEKEKLVKEGKIKKEKPLAAIKPSEIPYELPPGWEWVRLGDVAELKIGKTPSRNEPQYWEDQDYSWINISDMKHGETINISKQYVSQKAYDKVFKGKISPQGTLLMSFKLTIGKMSLLGIDAFHNEAIISIIPYVEDLKQYLFKCLSVFEIDKEKNKAIKGNTLNKNSLNRIILAIPPLAEQHRIVATVDRLLALCDELEIQKNKQQANLILLGKTANISLINVQSPEEFNRNWRLIFENFESIYSTPENVTQLRQAILQLAVMGKLVPQNSSDEPASILLEKIRQEKEKLVKEGKIKKEKPLAAIKPSEIPYELPHGWEWVRLGDVAELKIGKTPSRNEPQYWEDQDYSWINISDMKHGETINISKQYVSQKAYDKVFKGKISPQGTLLMSFKLTIGKMSLLGIDAFHNEAIISIIPYVEDLKQYLFKCLSVFEIDKEKNKAIKGNTLNKNSLNRIILAIPPLAEQHRIVATVDRLLLCCDQLEQKLTQASKNREELVEVMVNEFI